MSTDPFYDYLRDTDAAWITHDEFSEETGHVAGGANAGWHFCFAGYNSSPASTTRAYVLGEIGPSNKWWHFDKQFRTAGDADYLRVSTEEFYGGNGQTKSVLRDIVAADSSETFYVAATGGNHRGFDRLAILCTATGRLFVHGKGYSTLTDNCNVFGLGPSTNPNAGASRKIRPRFTQVLGEGGNLLGVRFTHCTIHNHAAAAVDSSGDVWFSGDPCRRSFASASQFPDDPGGLLNWFRKAEFTQYKDATGTVTPQSPLKWKKIVMGPLTILGISSSDKLYAWGSFCLGKVFTSSTPHEVSGFVDTVTVTNEGSGYTTDPTVTASAPENPDGTTAQLSITRANNKITGIAITNSGWGYTAAPTITITGGGGTNATATATIFDGTWKDCASVATAALETNESTTLRSVARECAAVSSDGQLYTVRNQYLNNTDSWVRLRDSLKGEAGDAGNTYDTVSLGLNFGCVLHTTATQSSRGTQFSVWGNLSAVNPGGLDLYALRTRSMGTTAKACGCFRFGVIALGVPNTFIPQFGSRVFAIGASPTGGRGYGTVPGVATITNVQASDLFCTGSVAFFNRIASYDELGNLIAPQSPAGS